MSSSFKSVRFTADPVLRQENGTCESYVPQSIVTHRDAYAASLHMVFKHTAQFFELMLDVVCDKYNLPVDDVVGAIMEDPRVKEMDVDPLVHSMGYFSKEDVEKHVPVVNDVTTTKEEPTEKSTEEKPKKTVVKKPPTLKKKPTNEVVQTTQTTQEKKKVGRPKKGKEENAEN